MQPKNRRRLNYKQVITLAVVFIIPAIILLTNQIMLIQVPVSVIVGSVIAGIILIIVIGGYRYKWKWTGFNYSYPKSEDAEHHTKTLWDWLQLLIIPLVLAGGAIFFNVQTTQTQLDLATDSQREAALQTYIDKMSELLLEERLRTSEDDSEIRSVARTRTILTLRQLDGERKGLLVQFLYESQLIENPDPIIYLGNTNFRGFRPQDLITLDQTSSVDLSSTNLSRVVLPNANFAGSYLRNANFSGALLSGTDFGTADLRNADFSGADLSEANLRHANLSGANLSGANLTFADLTSAETYNVDFSTASVGSMIWPDGNTHP